MFAFLLISYTFKYEQRFKRVINIMCICVHISMRNRVSARGCACLCVRGHEKDNALSEEI